jgi:hypothetical protein
MPLPHKVKSLVHKQCWSAKYPTTQTVFTTLVKSQTLSTKITKTEAGGYIGVTLGQVQQCGGFMPLYESQAPPDPQLLISSSAVAKKTTTKTNKQYKSCTFQDNFNFVN